MLTRLFGRKLGKKGKVSELLFHSSYIAIVAFTAFSSYFHDGKIKQLRGVEISDANTNYYLYSGTKPKVLADLIAKHDRDNNTKDKEQVRFAKEPIDSIQPA